MRRKNEKVRETEIIMGKIPEWVWCETCDCAALVCPTCGNNCCNGTYGQDGKCPDCEAVCKSQHQAYETGTIPAKAGLRVLPNAFGSLFDK